MEPLETMMADSWSGVRALGRDRSFTFGALFILTLGVAANTAVFSLVNGILLRPLGYSNPGQLLVIQELVDYRSQIESLPVNARHFLAWKQNCRAFEDIALMDGLELNLSGAGDPERVRAARVTPNYFDLLGINPQAGRSLTSEDGQLGHDSVAILSYSLWQRRSGGDPRLIGKSIDVNG